MSGVAIVTDSNSGITQEEAKRLGIFVLPMPFYIDGELFYEDISLTQEKFYERLTQDADISTSQPSPGDVLDIWEKALEEYDEVVHIVKFLCHCADACAGHGWKSICGR